MVIPTPGLLDTLVDVNPRPPLEQYSTQQQWVMPDPNISY
jgi:hypothetical protein